MDYAVINSQTHIVENVVVLDENSHISFDDAYHLPVVEGAMIGATYDPVTRIFTPPVTPDPEPEVSLIIISAVTLWERMTEEEAAQVETVMATQPFRTRQIFMTAQTFRSDHELWPLLIQMATELFGEERASELLAAG